MSAFLLVLKFLDILRRQYLTYCKKFEGSKPKIIIEIFFLSRMFKIHFLTN